MRSISLLMRMSKRSGFFNLQPRVFVHRCAMGSTRLFLRMGLRELARHTPCSAQPKSLESCTRPCESYLRFSKSMLLTVSTRSDLAS